MDPDPAAGVVGGAGAAPAGAVVVPMAVAAAPPGPAAGAAAAARPARDWRNLRLRWTHALFVLGCAAAALAAFSMTSSSSRLEACALTGAEASALRTASEELLLAAAAQVLGATTAVLLPGPLLISIFSNALGWITGYRASQVLWMLVDCHGHVHPVVDVYYSLFVVGYFVAHLAGGIISLCDIVH